MNICLKEIGCEDVEWIHLAQDRIQWWVLVNMVIKFWVPLEVGYFMTASSHKSHNVFLLTLHITSCNSYTYIKTSSSITLC